jgi:hypothetical protein
MQIQSASDVVTRIANDPQFEAAVKANPREAISAAMSPLPDNWIYRIIVGSLGLICLLAIIGEIYLVAMGKFLPEGVIALASAAVGALAGLLAPTPNR